MRAYQKITTKERQRKEGRKKVAQNQEQVPAAIRKSKMRDC